MSVPTFIEQNRHLITRYDRVPHVYETDRGNMLHPEFYHVYKFLLHHFMRNTPDDALLESTDAEYYTININTNERVEAFNSTRLLDTLLEYFPNSYLGESYYLKYRNISQAHQTVTVPDALSSFFEHLGSTEIRSGENGSHPNSFRQRAKMKYVEPFILSDIYPRIYHESHVHENRFFLDELFELNSVTQEIINTSYFKDYFRLGKEVFSFTPFDLLLPVFKERIDGTEAEPYFKDSKDTLGEVLLDFMDNKQKFMDILGAHLVPDKDLVNYYLKRASNKEKEEFFNFLKSDNLYFGLLLKNGLDNFNSIFRDAFSNQFRRNLVDTRIKRQMKYLVEKYVNITENQRHYRMESMFNNISINHGMDGLLHVCLDELVGRDFQDNHKATDLIASSFTRGYTKKINSVLIKK